MDESDYERAAWLEQAERAAAAERIRAAAELGMPAKPGETRLCMDCRDPIPAARLEAQPRAVRCTECQRDQEYRTRLGEA